MQSRLLPCNDIGPRAALARYLDNYDCTRPVFFACFVSHFASSSLILLLPHERFCSSLLTMSPSASSEVPSSILIVGSGAFGLSTAYSLCQNPRFKNTSITVVDRQPFPTPDGSSVSRAPQSSPHSRYEANSLGAWIRLHVQRPQA